MHCMKRNYNFRIFICDIQEYTVNIRGTLKVVEKQTNEGFEGGEMKNRE